MGTIVDAINAAWRDYLTDGVPASGPYEPAKSEIRAIGPLLETAIGNAAFGALVSVTKPTKSALDADLAHADGTVAIVYGDSTAANNDLYVKSGASGAGSWANTGVINAAFAAVAGGYADSVANAKRARAGISGRITGITWSGAAWASTPTVTIGAGEQWEENNGGAVKRKIAALGATALAAGEGIVVNFDSGSTDGTGAYIPTKVAIASGAQVGWQSAGRYVLVARDSNGLLFGHYVNNTPDLTGAEATAKLARARISGQVTAVTWSGTNPTVTLGLAGQAWIESNGGAPWRTIAPVGATALNSGEGLVVDFDAGSVDGSGRYIPTKVTIASSAQSGWQSSKNRFVLIAVDQFGNLFGEYAKPADNPNIGIYDAEVAFSVTSGTPLPIWDAGTRTLTWPEMALLMKRPSYTGRIKLQAGSVVFPSGNYHVATLNLAAVDNTLTPNTAVTVSSYVSGGWAGNDSTHIPLFCVNGDAAYPVRFPPVQGSLIGPGSDGEVSIYDPSEIVALLGATQCTIYKKGSNPASNRYLRFRMQRVTTPAINSDVWRWNEVWESERTGEFTFSDLRQLANNGEMEMAIRIKDKGDFIGGTAHGDEELFSASLLIDGVNVALGTAGNFRAERVEVFQGSDMYEPETTPAKSNRVGKAYKHWLFTADYIDVKNYIPWEDSLILDQCFMGMLTWLRNAGTVQISDKGFRSPLWAEEDISKSYAITVTAGGTGFTDGETVNITAQDGSGTGMTGVATVSGGAVTAVSVNIGTGSNYTLGEAVYINAADGSGTGATGTLNAGFSAVQTTAHHAKASGGNGYSAEVEVLKGWDRPGRFFYFSNSAEYNKFYFEFCGPNYAVSAGDIFESHVRYRLDTRN